MSGFRHDDQELAKNIREIAKRCAGREQPAPGEPSADEYDKNGGFGGVPAQPEGGEKPLTARQKVYAFLSQPRHIQEERARKLGLMSDVGNPIDGEEKERLAWIAAAKEKSCIDELLLGKASEPSSPPAPAGGAREFNERELRIQWTNPIHPDEIYQFAEAYADQKVRELRQERDALAGQKAKRILQLCLRRASTGNWKGVEQNIEQIILGGEV